MEKKGKIIIILSIIIIIGVISYFVFFNDKNIDKKNELKELSQDYFEKYMSTNDSTSTYIVTLDMLENAKQAGENYNLQLFKSCKRQSTLARITIDYKTGKPKDIKIELNC